MAIAVKGEKNFLNQDFLLREKLFDRLVKRRFKRKGCAKRDRTVNLQTLLCTLGSFTPEPDITSLFFC